MRAIVSREHRKSGKSLDEHLFALVSAVIGQWDPYALIASGGAARRV